MSEYKIGVDIGGTFTDVVLWDVAGGRTRNAKLLTTPDDPSRAVREGVRRILDENGVPPVCVVAVIHGTTLVANALIERKGVQTGFITTRGFRDVLEIGREWRYDLFDLGIEMPEPIAGRPQRAEITERVDAEGKILTPLALGELEQVVENFLAAGVVSIGVAFSMRTGTRNMSGLSVNVLLFSCRRCRSRCLQMSVQRWVSTNGVRRLSPMLMCGRSSGHMSSGFPTA